MAKTAEEIQIELEELEEKEYLLQMKDHWSASDYATDRTLRQKIKMLEFELEELEDKK